MRGLVPVLSIILAAAARVVVAQDHQQQQETNAWTSIVQHLPPCAVACLDPARRKSTCVPTDLDCACGVVLAAPLMEGCVLTQCKPRDALTARSATATACHVPTRDRGAVLPPTMTTLCSIALVCIALRLFCSPMSQKRNWLQVTDDWYMVVNALLLIGMMTSGNLVRKNNFGMDIWGLTIEQVRNILILIYTIEIYYTLMLMFTKLSILNFYLRFFPFTVFPGLRTAIYATIGVTVASGIAFTGTMVFQCTPIHFMWSLFDDPAPTGSCIDINLCGWIHGAFNLALDIWMLALPLPELLKLSLPMRKKVVVCLMFTVGGFVTVVSIPRIMTMVSFKHSTNPTYDQFNVSLWAQIEAPVSVILACIPRISILFTRLHRKYQNSTRRRQNLRSHGSSTDQFDRGAVGHGGTKGPVVAGRELKHPMDTDSSPGVSQISRAVDTSTSVTEKSDTQTDNVGDISEKV